MAGSFIAACSQFLFGICESGEGEFKSKKRKNAAARHDFLIQFLCIYWGYPHIGNVLQNLNFEFV